MTLIIPCYNEANRLNQEMFVSEATSFSRLIFVDDGSTDETREKLKKIVRKAGLIGGTVDIVSLPTNQGKAEAVRQGILYGLKQSRRPTTYGFTDADLSTPLKEMLRLNDLLLNLDFHLVLGSRVKLSGLDIVRNPLRHFAGRIAATLISRSLGLQVYDTQAGAKIFSHHAASQLFKNKFISSWLFDCELLMRSKDHTFRICEEPLQVWRHQGSGYTFGPRTYLRCLMDLTRIRKQYSAR
ncbi:MAG: dolichyl-phosphate beta-glucosyltransferase [Parasphingorhabdus sp.]|jgi:dolichyl-phosphate beta-glucosyltransferase